MMQADVREMKLEEVGLVIDYFHQSTPEHLELLGVDPTRLPPPKQWLDFFQGDFGKPIERRKAFFVIWLSGGMPIGFSSTDRIVFGKEAYMHLHVTDPQHRAAGMGTACVRESACLYFERLKLERLFCEPHAFNVAPNRTLQKAGFRYVKTHHTVPGPLNFHQAVNRWVMERPA